MINLLPPDLKDSYRYALHNVKLIRWAVALGFGFIGLIAISTASVIYMRQLAQTYEKPIADAQITLQKQNLHATQAQVKDITGNLKLAVQVLSKEVLFSKLIVRLANLTPDNTVLTDLSIIQAQTAVTISARTTDYNAATQMQANLLDPSNKIFSHADIQGIVCETTKAAPGTIEAKYPCVVTIKALFATNNPFLLINDTGH
jgi:Tfp pilus assembly protein PilN